MKIKLITIVYLYLLNFVDSKKNDIIFSTIIFRHGDRTPVRCYPNDPNANYSLWNTIGFGQLTKKGKAQQYALGEWLRDRYNDLISPEYNVNEIYVHSTDVDRTLMSALSNLAAMFPPKPDQIWSDHIKDWQPIPVHTIPEQQDNVLSGGKKCKKYDLEMQQLMISPTFKRFEELNGKLYNYLTVHTGKNITTINDLSYLYDTLFIEELYHLPLPEWTQTVYPHPLDEWSAFSFRIPCYTETLARLKIGLLLNEIVERMQQKVLNQLMPNRNLWVYSAHDITIANILMAMKVFNYQMPPYACAILFELRKIDNKYGINIYFKNTTNSKPYLLKLPNCDEFCELNKFKLILSPILINQEQWHQECNIGFLSTFTYTSQINTTAIFVVVSATFIILLLIASVAITLAYINRNRHSANKFYLRLDINEH